MSKVIAIYASQWDLVFCRCEKQIFLALTETCSRSYLRVMPFAIAFCTLKYIRPKFKASLALSFRRTLALRFQRSANVPIHTCTRGIHFP